MKYQIGMTLEEVERIAIEETLRYTEGDKTKAAQILNVSPKTIFNKTKRYEQDDKKLEEEAEKRRQRVKKRTSEGNPVNYDMPKIESPDIKVGMEAKG